MDFKTTKSYCTQGDVERTMGVAAAETNISQADILASIKKASDQVDLITHTRYWSVENSGTASGGTTTTLVDSGIGWTSNEYSDYVVWIYGGTGSGQYSRITSNTTDTLTLTDTLTTAPDATSTYRIIPDVYLSENVNGNDNSYMFLDFYPIKALVSLTIASTSITASKVYVYEKIGKLKLHSHLSPEATTFTDQYPQCISLEWVFGVYPVPNIIAELTAHIAAAKCLIEQIGGTYNDVTSYSIPGGFTASKGEPYTNIREALTRIQKETENLISRVIKYVAVA